MRLHDEFLHRYILRNVLTEEHKACGHKKEDLQRLMAQSVKGFHIHFINHKALAEFRQVKL
jgi:hypothetical protein